jgi:hypothetical protein
MRRPTIRVPNDILQRLVSNFTLSPRGWAGYPIDKVEHMMHFYCVLPPGFYYARYDTDAEEAVFQAQPFVHENLSIDSVRSTCINMPKEVKLLLSGE